MAHRDRQPGASLVGPLATVVIVIEETGWGVVPATAIGGTFRDRQGELAQVLERHADASWLVVQGRQWICIPSESPFLNDRSITLPSGWLCLSHAFHPTPGTLPEPVRPSASLSLIEPLGSRSMTANSNGQDSITGRTWIFPSTQFRAIPL